MTTAISVIFCQTLGRGWCKFDLNLILSNMNATAFVRNTQLLQEHENAHCLCFTKTEQTNRTSLAWMLADLQVSSLEP